MKKLWLTAIAIAVFSVSPTGAQIVIPLITIDEVGLNVNGEPYVTGVVDGEQAPSTRTFTLGVVNLDRVSASTRAELCHKSLLLGLSKPGQYRARIGTNTCALVLVTP